MAMRQTTEACLGRHRDVRRLRATESGSFVAARTEISDHKAEAARARQPIRSSQDRVLIEKPYDHECVEVDTAAPGIEGKEGALLPGNPDNWFFVVLCIKHDAESLGQA
jgi:hypothetical protein